MLAVSLGQTWQWHIHLVELCDGASNLGPCSAFSASIRLPTYHRVLFRASKLQQDVHQVQSWKKTRFRDSFPRPLRGQLPRLQDTLATVCAFERMHQIKYASHSPTV
jgi:hypothetical protein